MYTYFVIKSQDASIGDTVFNDLDVALYSLDRRNQAFGNIHTLVIETSEIKRVTKDRYIKFLMRHDRVPND